MGSRIRKLQAAENTATPNKTLNFSELSQVRSRHANQKIIQCHGVFDVLHAGHLAYFESAKKFGDILVVTLTSDEFVNKGPGHPYFKAAVRAKMVASLGVVDYVAISAFPTAVPSIEALKPHFYVKGPDYKNKEADLTRGIFLEEQAVKNGGGQLVFTEDETHSSSQLLHKFFEFWTPEQSEAIEAVRAAGGLSLIEEVLETVSREDVLIIGEPIVDTYVFCVPEALSSKSPSISAKYLRKEHYAGGSLAIANQLCDFTRKVTLLTTHGGEPYFREILAARLDPRVNMQEFVLAGVPTPQKTRYISEDRAQRLFEMTNLRSDQWTQHSPAPFCERLLNSGEKYSTNIVADFGHGLFEGPVLAAVGHLKGFVGLNVQTNSSNLGFNPLNKHGKYSYLATDIKELRLAFYDRFTPPLDLARKLHKDKKREDAALSLTVGPNGAYYFPAGSDTEVKVPAFADSVVDAVGAGDAFFGLSSLLVKVGCPNILIPFVGNVYAGLKTKIIGHQRSVSRAQLLKTISTILK